MGESVRAIEFVAEMRQTKTMADGSVNVTLNFPEHCREQAKITMDWHHLMVTGVLALAEDEKRDTGNGKKIHI